MRKKSSNRGKNGFGTRVLGDNNQGAPGTLRCQIHYPLTQSGRTDSPRHATKD
ncbi:5'-nucleotidase SurE [Clarias magur]|uniref:5'-nucleotidase SurE n=1 Tax=Clarias magur TaxID=1594786 RepID=A0A8J4UKT4_CLAMG|nr:5'-nucleotidase SurE [Clarias magur]